MRPEEPPEPAVPPESTTPPPEPPEQYALFLRYRERARGRRQRRRRHLLIAAGVLVVGTGLLTTAISWTTHEGPPPTTTVVEPAAVPSRESLESRAPERGRAAAQEGRVMATREPAAPTVTSSPALTPAPRGASVGYQPRERLTTVRLGDAKETVFELFATRFERWNGSVVRIEGMRLRASGRSPHHAQVEVAEVKIADTAAGSLHWFLFGDGRLVAWGRPEEWRGATGGYRVEIDYPPDLSQADRPGATR